MKLTYCSSFQSELLFSVAQAVFPTMLSNRMMAFYCISSKYHIPVT